VHGLFCLLEKLLQTTLWISIYLLCH